MGRISVVLAVVFCCFVFSHGGKKLDCECGVAKYGNGTVAMRIVGGKQVAPHSLPWLVLITIRGHVYCGASIITDRHVLSAGHCAQGVDYHIIEVVYGLHTLKDQSQATKRKVKHVAIHENYVSTKVRDENDIAIFYVASPVKFTDEIKPICLPPGEHDYGGLMAIVAGWGRVGSKENTSDVLLKTYQKILTQADCCKSGLGTYVTSSMMCAYLKGRDGCQGDSGGPMMVINAKGKYYQAGVVSWGIGCANPRYPGIYTNVSQYVDWIHKKTDDGITCRL